MSTALVLAALVSAATPAPRPRDIVFPPPPAPARIRFRQSLARAEDLGRPRQADWLKRAWGALLGRRPARGAALVRPYGVAVDGMRVYVADTDGTAVVVFDRAARTVTRIGGTRDGRLLAPIGVAVAPGGTLYVTDASQDVVKVFSREGRFLAAYHILRGLKRPTGIVYDAPRKRLLVADTGNSRVLAFTPAGKLLSKIGGRGTAPGRMSTPVNLTVDRDGRIYVVDPILARVQVFSSAGKFERAFGQRGNMVGQFARPRGIAVDSKGHVHVADALFNAVQIFDAKGRILMHYGGGGSAAGAFDLPGGVAIDDADRIYVADSMNRRVEIFDTLRPPPARKPPAKSAIRSGAGRTSSTRARRRAAPVPAAKRGAG